MPASGDDPNQRHAQQLAAFLSLYRPLVDGLVKEFFLDDYWTNLPVSWRAPLDALSFRDLAELLQRPTCSSPPGIVWPLSLLAFFATVHALRLPEQFKARGGTEGLSDEATNDLAASMAGLNVSDIDLRGPTGASWANNLRKSADGRCAEELYMGVDLRLAVKPKKMHEIIHLGSLTDRIARLAGCDNVVDVGSGQGYLSRALAFQYNWPVVALEMGKANVAASNRLDSMVQRQLAKRLKDARECAWQPGVGTLRHVAARLPPTATPERLWALLAPASAAAPSLAGGGGSREVEGSTAAVTAPPAAPAQPGVSGGRSLLVGLHTCGDLACTMLRVFDSGAEAVGAIVSVGCCYMHVTEHEPHKTDLTSNWRLGKAAEPHSPQEPSAGAAAEAETGGGSPSLEPSPQCLPCDAGYPMSGWVRRLGVPFGYHVRELACHHMMAYHDRLVAAADGDPRAEEALRSHCRRAVLELVLRRRGAGGCVGVIKNGPSLTFGAYVTACFHKLGLPPQSEEEEAATLAQCEPLLPQWRRVVVYYVLRLLLAPLWEAFLLLDRLLFLQERGYAAQLLPLFDPTLSPRNYAVLGVRRPGRSDAPHS